MDRHARLAAVAIGQPNLRIIKLVTAQEGYLLAVRRHAAGFGVDKQFSRSSAQRGNVPQAGALFLASDRFGEQMASVRIPAQTMDAEIVGERQCVGLVRGDLPQESSSRIDVSQIAAVGR